MLGIGPTFLVLLPTGAKNEGQNKTCNMFSLLMQCFLIQTTILQLSKTKKTKDVH